MKKISILFSLVALFSIASLTVNAQVTATATTSATIITPIAVAKNVDMNFGDVAVNATSGTVVLATAGTRTSTGGVTLPVITGTVAAAEFTVTGTSGYAYTFTLPSSATTVSDGTNTMTVDNWNSNSTGIITGALRL